MYIFTAPRKYVRKADARKDFNVTRGFLAAAAFVLGVLFPVLLAILLQMRLSNVPSAQLPMLVDYSVVVFGVLACLGLVPIFYVLSHKHRQQFEHNLKTFEKVPDNEMLVRTALYGQMLYWTISMVVACDLANALFATYVFNTIQNLS